MTQTGKGYRVLITGAAGSIGAPLLIALRAAGHTLAGIDLRHQSQEAFERADVAECRQLERAFHVAGKPPDVCIHLAAEFGRLNGEGWYEQMWRSNVIGTRNVVDLCARLGTRLVFASSSEAYGSLGESQEVLYEATLETLVPSFPNEYALSKWTNEQQIKIASRQRNLKAVVLRLFNIYGPGEYFTPYRSVVVQFLWKLLHGKPIQVVKGSTREMLYIDDFTATMVRLVERIDTPELWKDKDGCALPTFNLASGEPVEMNALAHQIAGIVGASTDLIRPLSGGDPLTVTQKRAGLDRARRLLGHNPLVALQEGLVQTRDWLKSISSARA